jgi:hypothetical protein
MRRLIKSLVLATLITPAVSSAAWAPTVGCAAVGTVQPSCSYIASGPHAFDAATDAAWRITGAGGRILAEGVGSQVVVGERPVHLEAHGPVFGSVLAEAGELVTITVTGEGVVRAGHIFGL